MNPFSHLKLVEPSTRSRFGSVHSINRAVMTVPSLIEAESFFVAFGLNCRRTSDTRLDVGTFDTDHAWLTILPGNAKKLEYMSFSMYESDYQVFLEGLTCNTCEPHPAAGLAGEAGGIWLEAPDGLAVHVGVGDKTSPSARTRSSSSREVLPGLGAAPARNVAGMVRPRYLSHMLLFTPDVDQALAFYCDLLGLRLSDRSASDIAFLHGAYGSDHHLLAFARSTGPGLHHTSWDVGSVDDVGLGAEQMRKNGYDSGWGLGRHVLGSNYFHYVRDPWGSYAEYSYGIDYVPATLEWPAADHPGEDSFYLWGPKTPDDFAVNYEIDKTASANVTDAKKLS